MAVHQSGQCWYNAGYVAPMLPLLVSLLSVGQQRGHHAYDHRIDRRHAPRRLHAPSPELSLPARHTPTTVRIVPREYASALVQVAFGGATIGARWRPPLGCRRRWEPLHWAWVADNGDLITRWQRRGSSAFLRQQRQQLVQEVDCRLQAWPEGNAEAPQAASRVHAGARRRHRAGRRHSICPVFRSERTTLPPEIIPDEKRRLPRGPGDRVSILQPDGRTRVPKGSSLPDEAPLPLGGERLTAGVPPVHLARAPSGSGCPAAGASRRPCLLR